MRETYSSNAGGPSLEGGSDGIESWSSCTSSSRFGLASLRYISMADFALAWWADRERIRSNASGDQIPLGLSGPGAGDDLPATLLISCNEDMTSFIASRKGEGVMPEDWPSLE